jgi:hypothetical protein
MNVQGQWFVPWMGASNMTDLQIVAPQLTQTLNGTLSQSPMGNPSQSSFYPTPLTLGSKYTQGLPSNVSQAKVMMQTPITTTGSPTAVMQHHQQQQSQHQAMVAAMASQQQFFAAQTSQAGFHGFPSMSAFHPTTLLAMANPATLAALGLPTPTTAQTHQLSTPQVHGHPQLGIPTHTMFGIPSQVNVAKVPLLKTPLCMKVRNGKTSRQTIFVISYRLH